MYFIAAICLVCVDGRTDAVGCNVFFLNQADYSELQNRKSKNVELWFAIEGT